jgi:hypothetical protein
MWRAEGPVHPSPVASICVRPIGKGSPIQRALHAKGDFVQDGRTPERIGAAGVALRLLRSREGTPPLVQATERLAVIDLGDRIVIRVWGHHLAPKSGLWQDSDSGYLFEFRDGRVKRLLVWYQWSDAVKALGLNESD